MVMHVSEAEAKRSETRGRRQPRSYHLEHGPDQINVHSHAYPRLMSHWSRHLTSPIPLHLPPSPMSYILLSADTLHRASGREMKIPIMMSSLETPTELLPRKSSTNRKRINQCLEGNSMSGATFFLVRVTALSFPWPMARGKREEKKQPYKDVKQTIGQGRLRE